MWIGQPERQAAATAAGLAATAAGLAAVALLLAGCGVPSRAPGPGTGPPVGSAATQPVAPPTTSSPTPAGCTGNDPNVAVPSAPHGLFVNAADSPRAEKPKAKALIDHYLIPDPTVCGANLIVPWSSIDRGPGSSPRYDWSFVNDAAAPWVAAGKTVNLIVWGVAEQTSQQWGQAVTPAYVLNQVDTVRCGHGTPATPVYWEPAYADNWRAFVAATVSHFAGVPWVGYIRFGIGSGGEDAVVDGLARPSCARRWRSFGLTEARWQAYSLAMVDDEAARQSSKPILVGINDFEGSHSLADAVAQRAAADGLGFGSQGLTQEAIAETQRGQPCGADWCALFATYAGKVPLEIQTYERSNPGGGPPVGALPPLLFLALDSRAQILELYPQEWLVADDPSWPGYAAHHAAYAAALAQAAAIVDGA